MTPPRPDIPQLADLDLQLTSARLALRPLVASDAEAMWTTVSDPAFPSMMCWAAHRSIDETRAWIEQCNADIARNAEMHWAITRDGVFAGTIALLGITWQVQEWRRDCAEIGFWIQPALQKQGIATEATMAVLRFGFETLGLHRITIGCLVENTASRRVIEKCNFRFIAQLDDDVWRADRWWSHLRYELTLAEWSDVTSTLRFSRPRRA